jgi:hypothetical protein
MAWFLLFLSYFFDVNLTADSEVIRPPLIRISIGVGTTTRNSEGVCLQSEVSSDLESGGRGEGQGRSVLLPGRSEISLSV